MRDGSKLVGKVVEEFEKIKLPEESDLEKWVLTLRGTPKTFACEGVILEFDNGDEYAIPFLLFSEAELKVLKPSWEQWVATKSDEEQKREHSLYLQSQAKEFQQNVQEQMVAEQPLAVAQLQMLAVASGAFGLWEVTMYPGQGVMGYPTNVVVSARDSQHASIQAMNRNPGYILGPVRKVAGR